MSNIKPSEISSILQMQLQNMSNKVQFEEIGKVLQRELSDKAAQTAYIEQLLKNNPTQIQA